MDPTETYSLAHTARCKLQMAADTPDRDLRFILGHAFTLDKLRLRIAEIEMDNNEEDEPISSSRGRRRVSFRNNAARPNNLERRRSPPPPAGPDDDDADPIRIRTWRRAWRMRTMTRRMAVMMMIYR